jgi:hypothetical protein
MSDTDFSAFDQAVNEFDASDFDKGVEEYDRLEKEKEAAQPTTFDDALSAFGQGATISLADELMAALDVVRGKAPADSKGTLDAWRTLQKAREEEYEKVKERSPMVALGGELLGGLAVPIPAALISGAGRAIGITPALTKIGTGKRLAEHIGSGTAVGLAAGLGSSKETIEGSPVELLKDTGVGGIFGGVTGGVLGTAFDKVKGAWESIKNTPSYEKLVAAMELAEGKRPDYEEGSSVLFGEKPNIIPGEETSGSQKVLTALEKNVASEIDSAVKIQSDAKQALNQAIDRNKKVPARPASLTDEAINEFEKFDLEEANDLAFKQFKETLTPKEAESIEDLLQAYAKKVGEAGENLTMGEIRREGVNELLSKMDPKLANRFLSIRYFAENEARIKNLKDLANRSNNENFKTYANNLSELLSIGGARPESNLFRIRNVLFSIDRPFMRKLMLNPYNITAKELFNFRRNFLARASYKAIEKDLDVGAREILFGIKNAQTGKYDGGVFNSIENIMRSSSEDVKKFIDNVNAKSQHIEVLLNNHPDPKFHASKAWDFEDAELNSELAKILSDAVSNIGTDTISAHESANLIMNYFNAMLKSETNPEIQKQIMERIKDVAKKFEKRGYEFGALAESSGMDRTAGPSIGSTVDPTKWKTSVKSSNLSKLGQVAGQMKKSTKETVEQIPPIIRKPIAGAARLPFTFKNASENQLRSAAEVLKKSSNPAVKRFGEGIEDAATNNPYVRNAIINSAFQRGDIRKALGLVLGTEEEKEE